MYLNICLKIKIYLQIYFSVSFQFPQKCQLSSAYIPSFSLWYQNIFEYLFKLVPQIYLNIHLLSFQYFKYICIFV